MGEVVSPDVLEAWRAHKQKQTKRPQHSSGLNYTNLFLPEHFYWECVGPCTSSDSDTFVVLTGKDVDPFFIQL